MVKQLIIKTSATGIDLRIIINEDDTAVVTYDGSTTNYPNSQYDWSIHYGSPTVATLNRRATRFRDKVVYHWNVVFAFGATVSAWPPKTFEARRRKRAENDLIWVWIQIPVTLIQSVTGVCGEVCNMDPDLPWCAIGSTVRGSRVRGSTVNTVTGSAVSTEEDQHKQAP